MSTFGAIWFALGSVAALVNVFRGTPSGSTRDHGYAVAIASMLLALLGPLAIVVVGHKIRRGRR